jgi:putative DNA primase/helicase
MKTRSDAAVTSLRELARALGGEVSNGQVLCPGPGHSIRDRSLSLRLSATAPDGFIAFSHAGDPWDACRDYVCRRLGVTWSPPRTRSPKSNWWRALWDEARNPIDTPVERYLASRGLPLPAEAAGEALRFHPRCPFGPEYTTPAMVALVRDIRSNAPLGVHRTALDSLGHKREINGKDRMALGAIKGGVVKISPDEDVTLAVGIAEGIETTLSLRLLPDWGFSPIWACLSAGTLAAFPVLSGVESLIVGVDHDEAGRNAARQAITRWHEAGRETLALIPKRPGADLNDLVRREA